VSRSTLRPEALNAPSSGIVEVFDYGRGRPGLIPLWVGEGDLSTPAFISEAATRSLAAGETFYTYQSGLPDLRQAIAAYVNRHYATHLGMDRFHVTIGGMHALQMALRMVAGSGDEILIPTPAWPNFYGAAVVSGAQPVDVPMTLQPRGNDHIWALDFDRMKAAVSPKTKAIIINSPSNPTGWTATRAELEQVLELARQQGLWIIADEIYGRFVYDGALRAPSFHDIMAETDKIMFVQTLSKNWAMTGWRIGWLECPDWMGETVENLVQYSSSGVAAFMQRAAIAALEQGEAFVNHQLARARAGRDIVTRGLSQLENVHFGAVDGAFYLFFRVDGITDTRQLALDLVDHANVGLAPGTAFGTGAKDYMRMCFARKAEDLEEATRRIVQVLARQ
jgi:aspartate/methionine/tyrosine aminotransferase